MKVASSIVFALAVTFFYTTTVPCESFCASSPLVTVDGGAFQACVKVLGGGTACAVPGY